MAQLNPNFEIDFNDINSYEQIQLINDTQLAKENLLMHKAYKEPAEDEIIRNQFSSFTFVDFCPKLFNSALKSPPTPTNNEHNKSSASSTPLRHQQYMLETFSDLFDRINLWLKVNRDWRVISMETLVFDCASQFNHLKSSFHSATLPRNMRGLRLYLSPTKSRFSGPQKIGCINVIPRKISGHNDDDGEHTESIEYETLDQILARLNELLLTRPIEGRILSVETITLPIVNGYVNTETNYFMDNRLNALSQRIYSHANDGSTAASASATRTKSRSRMASETVDQSEMAAGAPAASRTRVDSDTSDHYQAASGADTISGAGQQQQQQQVPLTDASSSPRQRQQRAYQPNGLIDTLRVYYEFGPMVCGLVNLIDFLPRFNLRQAAGVSSTVASPVPDRDLDKIGEPTTTTEDKDGGSSSRSSSSSLSADDDDDEQLPRQSAPVEQLDIDSTESLTRLIGRSLNWFESERKRVLAETSGRSDNDDEDGQNVEVVNSSETSTSSDSSTETETETEAGIEANNTGRRRRQATGSDNRRQQVRLKVCNLQIHKKVMLKSRLAKVTPQTAVEVVNSRQMFHEPPKEPIVCHQCDLSSANNEVHEWCTHLLDLNQAFELKFIRLAYVVPVCNVYAARYAKSLRSLPAFRLRQQQQHEDSARNQSANIGTGTQTSPDAHSSSFPAQNRTSVQNETDPGTEKSKELPSNMEAIHDQSRSSSRTSDSHEGAENDEGESEDGDGEEEEEEEEEEEDEEEDEDVEGEAGGNEVLGDILAAHDSAEKLAKEVSLEIVRGTNRRHKRYEQLHQLNEDSIGSDCPERSSVSPEPGQLIGQLTYRLFAPCQLVNSSSCFSINPVNSSNPLARRGSVVSDGGSSSENATPSTLLLPTGSGSGVGGESLGESTLTLNSNHDQQQQQQQQLLSFGAFFPALSHDPILGSHNNNQRLSGSGATGQQHTGKGGGNNSGHRFATNEFEPVEAIRRRMEVYVTTNSMKVLAGETLVVNLSDHLSCLSNAIEQTIIKASFSAARQPSTWVSVYILYAAVDEPHLPIQLLEQQKLRERLELISEADEDEQQQQQAGSTGSPRIDDHQIDQGPTIGAPTGESLGEHNMVPVFDDDFKCEQQPAPKDQDHPETAVPQQQQQQQQQQPQGLSSTLASLKLENGNIRVELSRPLGHQTDLPPYNSAYDRTVALPTQPDDHLSNYLEPVDVNLAGSWALQQQPPQSLPGAGNVWLDENDLIEVHSYHLSNSNIRDASKLLRMRQQRQQQQQQLAMQAKPGGGAELRNSSWKGGRERKKVKGKRRSRRSGEHSQCSIM